MEPDQTTTHDDGLERERARQHALHATLRAAREASQAGELDAEGFEATMAKVLQIEIDVERMANDLHVPEDAGEWAEGLSRILRRIPDGWGRYISCERGWYPLLVELDEKLSKTCEQYVVLQVKEKFGALRYYFEVPASEDGGVDEAVYTQMEQLVEEAEARSARTCERTGKAGVLMRSHGWYKTLDPESAGAGWEPVPRA